mmetsp:Transcript_3593/g.9853  ORF Transcript_3593/g.9853 Transcript_3593/m.9853 type:complete len:111 (+) Transcript_3593:386-718(+)
MNLRNVYVYQVGKLWMRSRASDLPEEGDKKSCFNNHVVAGRACWERCVHRAIKSRHSGGARCGNGGVSSEFAMRFRAKSKLLRAPSPHGFSPVAISMTVHPKLQMSAPRP